PCDDLGVDQHLAPAPSRFLNLRVRCAKAYRRGLAGGVRQSATRPPLTSVDMNLVELGREGGRRMLDLIAGRKWQGVERLPCSLIVRQSCGAKRILTG